MSRSQIFSVYTQIEEVIAEAMITEQKARKIHLNQFPDEVDSPNIWQDAEGHRAKFAVVMSTRDAAEFQQRVAQLRA